MNERDYSRALRVQLFVYCRELGNSTFAVITALRFASPVLFSVPYPPAVTMQASTMPEHNSDGAPHSFKTQLVNGALCPLMRGTIQERCLEWCSVRANFTHARVPECECHVCSLLEIGQNSRGTQFRRLRRGSLTGI